MAEENTFKGKLLESKPELRIFEGFPYNTYEILAPNLSEKELVQARLLAKVITRSATLNSLLKEIGSKDLEAVEQFRNKVIQTIDVNGLTHKLPSSNQYEMLAINLLPITEKFGVQHKQEFINHVLDNSIGYGPLSPLMSDPQLEEIMVNGFARNVFVFHRKFGSCKTNIVAGEKSHVFRLVKRIAFTVDRQFSEAHPLLDARLPDGSRANATFNYVSPFGHTLTIRKFSKIPLSIIDMIANGTMSSELAAFLWTMVQGLAVHPMNAIVTGGTGSGKTTLMNVLASFIPFQERIISIEDTVELDLGIRENWIQLESRPKMREVLAVSMDELLKNTLRMRPDRIIVGEVRGREAETLFVAMDTGHTGILGTLHSNNPREMVLRLKNAPMNVPEQMLPLLDMAVVMQRHYDRKYGIMRRIKQVAEIGRMDEQVLLNNIYELDEKKDKTARTSVPSSLVEKLASSAGITKNELKREILIRRRILDFLLEQGIRQREDVEKIVQQYYFSPESVLKRVASHLE